MEEIVVTVLGDQRGDQTPSLPAAAAELQSGFVPWICVHWRYSAGAQMTFFFPFVTATSNNIGWNKRHTNGCIRTKNCRGGGLLFHLQNPVFLSNFSLPLSPLMTKRIEEKKAASCKRQSHQFLNFLSEVIGCVLTGQEVLGGGAKVSVGLLQQLQSVFHRHLHEDTQMKLQRQSNRTSQQGVMVKWSSF